MKPVHHFNGYKDDGRHQKEVQDGAQEHAVVDGHGWFLPFGRFEGPLQASEIQASQQKSQRRHDHITDQRAYNLSKSPPDDDPYREINHASSPDERFEFVEE